MSLFSPKSPKLKSGFRSIGSNMGIKSFEQLSAMFGHNNSADGNSKTNVSLHKSKVSICYESENIVLSSAPSSQNTIPAGPIMSPELDRARYQSSDQPESGAVRALPDAKSPPRKEYCVELPGSFSFDNPNDTDPSRSPTPVSPSQKKEEEAAEDPRLSLISGYARSPPVLTVSDFGNMLRRDQSPDRDGRGDTYVSHQRTDMVKGLQLNLNGLRIDDPHGWRPWFNSPGDLETIREEKQAQLTLLSRETQETVKAGHDLGSATKEKEKEKEKEKNDYLQPYDPRICMRKNGQTSLQNFPNPMSQEIQHASHDDSCRANYHHNHEPYYSPPKGCRPRTFSHMSECSCHRNETAALQFRIVELEYHNATLESKLRQYRDEIKLFKKDVKGYKKDEKRYLRALQEKDAEIAALNEKIAQLVGQLTSNNSSLGSLPSPITRTITSTSKLTTAPTVTTTATAPTATTTKKTTALTTDDLKNKELPLPIPSPSAVDSKIKARRRQRSSRTPREDGSSTVKQKS